jgi:chromosome segregation protein
MRLRSIHIKGFKSFPLDTTIHFNERVTGVVGPNGSGKSNIVDAIRWVLGEQKTTELRLGAMSDVLFNGTKKRKKSGLAQVTLYFDNTKNLIPTDYNQVAISRLLFRSGESEYRINDVPCRLKDVRSLFADTGIGSDSYAIIALNMVDDILTDNDGSRRRMFEQASGISKYKKRKKETLNKLKNTNADLDRVEDLLFEIGNNLQELEKQARRVERFLKIKEQYKTITVQLNLRQYDEISKNRENIKVQIKEETDKHRAAEVKLRTLEANLQEAKKAILSNESELSAFQKDINQFLDEIRRLENDKQLCRQQIEFTTQKQSNLIQDQKSLKEQSGQLEQRLKAVRERLLKDEDILKRLSHAYETTQSSYEQSKQQYELVKADHDALNAKKQLLEEKRFQQDKNIAVSENQLERLRQQNDRRIQKKKELTRDRKELSSGNEEKVLKLKGLENRFESLQVDLSKRKDRIKELDELRLQLRQKKEKETRKLDARTNEYDLIKSMVDSLEGFPESIKYLNKSWKSNAVLLTDLIYAPDEYKLAIESFLDPYLNYYVVEDHEDAYDAINLLHGSMKGKANFFMLDRMDESPKATKDKDGMLRAIEVLEYDEKYYALLSHLLYNVYITDLDIRDVEMYANEMEEEDYHILGKNGSFMATKSSLSGGSVGLFEGKKLGRKKNLEKLQREIQSLSQNIDQLDNQLVKHTDEMNQLSSTSIEQSLDDLRKQIEKEKLGMVEMEMKMASFDRDLQQLTADTDQYEEEIKQLEKAIEDAGTEKKLIDQQLVDLFSGSENKDSSLQVYSERLSRDAEKKNAANIELIKHQNLVDSLKNEEQYNATDLEKNKRQLELNANEIEALKEKKIELEDRLVQMDKSLVEKYESKKQREEKLSDVEKAFYDKRGKITELEEEISVLRRSIHQSQFLINELKEKLHDQDFRLQSVTERVKIEFNMTLDELKGFERSEIPLHELEEKHDRLKRKIENFGEVNTLAIEAFNEMKIRFETIEKQKEDIVQAQENLLRTIDEIEKIATERYVETFEVVKEYFKEVFMSLFSEGDTCDILMENPENPLESKIEIIAKPKGKRPKTLNQLSGGEKTLTAIALLFSLYLYKPAPFCIFDEVDAPLDDANIQKFNKIVKKFSKESQFIIITHNKSTMAAVDVLYGVFMQEMGVSEVAAVDFRAYEPLTPVMNPN